MIKSFTKMLFHLFVFINTQCFSLLGTTAQSEFNICASDTAPRKSKIRFPHIVSDGTGHAPNTSCQWPSCAKIDQLSLSNQLLPFLQSSFDRYILKDQNSTDTFTQNYRELDFEDHSSDWNNNHKYYEGYFHALNHCGCKHSSKSPRRHQTIDKPAAPTAFRAFIEAFKQVNNDTLTNIINQTALQNQNYQSNIFADLAIQISVTSIRWISFCLT